MRIRLFLLVAALVALLAGVLAETGPKRHSAEGATRVPPGAAVITVSRAVHGRAIPAGFLGLSLEYSAVEAYAGQDPSAPDPVLEQLIRNLSPAQAPVIRIGGDSTDWAWWPVPGMSRPPGVHITLTPRWLAVTRALSRSLGARLILGIDLEADSATVAAVEAHALIRGLGRGAIEALEPGNEPELYGTFGWDGSKAPGRPRDYDFSSFTRDFTRIGAALPNVPLAGPTTGAPKWMRQLARFLTAESRVGVVTLHRYPLQACFVSRSQPQYPTIGHLLSDMASAGLAQGIAPYAAITHAHRLALRIDEMNTVSCGGAAGVSNSFASALWALDAAFQMARVGVDGINIHTYPKSPYELFALRRVNGRWGAFVQPEYYGLLMFAQAAPPGSRLLVLTVARGRGIRAWATRAPDGRIRIVAINDAERARVAAIRAPVTTRGATLELLRARSLRATKGVTVGGQSFGSRTETGSLAGGVRVHLLLPEAGEYVVKLPAASATLLTLPAG